MLMIMPYVHPLEPNGILKAMVVFLDPYTWRYCNVPYVWPNANYKMLEHVRTHMLHGASIFKYLFYPKKGSNAG